MAVKRALCFVSAYKSSVDVAAASTYVTIAQVDKRQCIAVVKHSSRSRVMDCVGLFVDHVMRRQVLRSVDSPGTVITAVVLSHGGRMLFVGTSSGGVRSLRFPLATPSEWSEFRAHGAAISRVITSCENTCLSSSLMRWLLLRLHRDWTSI